MELDEQRADLCDAFAGRLSDITLEAVRVFYYAGEEQLGDSTLLVGLAAEGVEVTQAEFDEIQAVVTDADEEELRSLRMASTPPSLRHRFESSAPVTAPHPLRADEVLALEAQRHPVLVLRRTWRSGSGGLIHGRPDTWLYVVTVAAGADRLRVHSALSSRLGVECNVAWPIEVIAHGAQPTPYQAAALRESRSLG